MGTPLTSICPSFLQEEVFSCVGFLLHLRLQLRANVDAVCCTGVCFLPSCALSWGQGCAVSCKTEIQQHVLQSRQLVVVLFFVFFNVFKLDRTFFSYPWKQNSTNQSLNDNDPKQRLIHHRVFKRHFDITGNVNPGIFIINTVEAFDWSPGRGLLNLTRLYMLFQTWRPADEELRQRLVRY